MDRNVCILTAFVALVGGSTVDYSGSTPRDLALADELKDCPGNAVDIYYDLYLTIECASDKDDCTFEDFMDMGELLDGIVAEIQGEYITYKQEFLDTMVCPVPGESVSPRDGRRERDSAYNKSEKDASPRQLKAKFTTEGRGRTCKKGTAPKSSDRNTRRPHPSTRSIEAPRNGTVYDPVTDACENAETAVFGGSAAFEGFEQCNHLAMEIKKLAIGLLDEETGENFVQDAAIMLKTCKSLEYKARKAAREAPQICRNAKKSAKLARSYAEDAKEYSKKALAAAREIHTENEVMVQKRKELMKMILDQNFGIQRKELMDIEELGKKSQHALEPVVDTQIQMFEDRLFLAESSSERAQLKEKRNTLLQMKEDQAEKLMTIEKGIQKTKAQYEKKLNEQIKDANVLLDIDIADIGDKWLNRFGELLELVVPGRLAERYSGCLTTEPKVSVLVQDKSKWTDVVRKKCKPPP